MTLPIFEKYPQLVDEIPHVALGQWPTPLESNDALTQQLGAKRIYLKRDDLSAETYGGNKVRKLEFLLAEAAAKKKREVLTVGYAGSNHALATAIYAKQLGLGSISMLLPQVNARSVQRNLLAGFTQGAELHTRPDVPSLTRAATWQIFRHGLTKARFPYYIPAGGSSPLGVIGFVNAAFEIAKQFEEMGEAPPDRVYVAMGSMGSLIGLHIGFQVLDWPTVVVGVRVTEKEFANVPAAKKLFDETVAFIREHAPDFPAVEMDNRLWDMRDRYFGEEYGRYTDEGAEAAKRMRETSGIHLDGTYSAKAFAAVLADGNYGDLEDTTAVFWLTYNSRDMTPLVADTDYKALPPAFHEYFESPVQELDRHAD